MPVLDDVAQVDERLRDAILHKANTPIAHPHDIERGRRAMRHCHQPLTTKPAAPTTFIH